MPNHKTWLSLIFLTGVCFLTTRSQEENTVGSVLDDVKVTTFSYSVTTGDTLTETTTVQHVSAQSEPTLIGGRDHESSTAVFEKSSSPSWQTSVPVVTSFSSTWRPPENSSNINVFDQAEDNSVNAVVHPSKDDDRENVSDLIDPNLTTAKTKHEQPVTEKVPTETPSSEDSESEWADMDYCVLTQIECVEPVQCKGKGNVDCSPQDKLPWLSEDYNSSLIDQLLPREPRLRRSTNTKLARDRKRNQGSRNRNRESPNGQQEDDDLDKEPCKTEETLLCTAELNLVNCRGVGRCDAAPPDTTGSYLADWEIAVIAVLTLAGVLLVVFLVYIIYGAWRKKKVQPLNHRNGRSNS